MKGGCSLKPCFLVDGMGLEKEELPDNQEDIDPKEREKR
jgi:hypothetical protein